MLDRLTDEEMAGLCASIPLGHVTVPAEIAGTAGWLCSPAAASITGTVIDGNGGMWTG